MSDLRIVELLVRGLTAISNLYPFWGIVKV